MFDGVAGTATFYNAPAKFLGDKSSSYGSLLKFDLQVNVTPNSNTAGARLIGGGITLVKLLSALASRCSQLDLLFHAIGYF
ncbi:MAG: laminin B domain-containing protein [Cytophagales bacterium]|nr:laminin B domain-containing protein [Cytophagales bacterium]